MLECMDMTNIQENEDASLCVALRELIREPLTVLGCNFQKQSLNLLKQTNMEFNELKALKKTFLVICF